ncbi:1-deoxy-D-xylulose-5-phosphate synthase [Acetobacteroides hydrogenigenes]|uniref:1-deoxy-D-xylulose-5-phosphate synthase n=1 Tax=Acetobacteroides hydrogenigenes TaxID=979970 RepID=A0A4R2E381_9BACT|nr:1-deoxy-D-xylulose-5-phosphate synthase [Acetobacteroides hydrogenigenes]TCN61667.1 1-deoxy-D-xylulose-5-phosphate synthase [Acetobacteroides hydrogenigenes]
MTEETKRLLESIDTPNDLKRLDVSQLEQVCSELREFIIDQVSTNPGHFGAGLGVVELTVALHYVFNTPYDKLIWDVGHQAYPHKILTGRRKQFHTNRKYKGLSGFPKMDESEYDAFGVGHSSTSISAALGMAIAAKMNKESRHVVAIIGDGSMTAGLAFEGLNNAGIDKSDLLVILNDNNMAIDANVGALKEYLLDITTSKSYNKMRKDVWNILGNLERLGPVARRYVKKIESGVKTALLQQSNLFQSLNFRYFGPIDGHDVERLTQVLNDLKDIPGPKLLHVLTKKGKGYKPAEEDQTIWHAPGVFDKETGLRETTPVDQIVPPRYQDVFGETIVELAEKNPKILGITPAMPSGCSLNIMMEKMPSRAFDVGIAEQHAVTFSAGLAAAGYIPYCNIYSSFMQRAYDNVIHDVALQNLDVVFCLDRGGIVGEDGPTHHGMFDIGFFRIIPNMVVAAPMNEVELRNMMYTAQLGGKGPFSIRYPRGRGVTHDWKQPFTEIEVGKGRTISEGNDVAFVTLGHPGNYAQTAVTRLAKQGIAVGLYDMRFAKPLDEELLHSILKRYRHIITVEDGALQGGFGSAVLEFMADNGYTNSITRLGAPDRFIEHGTVQQLHKDCGIDPESLFQTALKAAMELPTAAETIRK